MNMTTDFQANLYEFISQRINESGYSPSFSEITAGLGISPRSKSLITRSLRVLEKEGKLILKKQGRHLQISLSTKQLLLLGRISAGVPIEAISEPQVLDINKLIDGDNLFGLEVKGTSMIEEGILDGDLIICQRTEMAKEGSIVVALIDNHNTTLKRISYKMKGMITLSPANVELKPRAYLPERIQIQGIYIGLIRMNS